MKTLKQRVKAFLLNYSPDSKIAEAFQVFTPNFEGTKKARAHLIILCANQLFPALQHYLTLTGRHPVQPIDIADFRPFPGDFKPEDVLKDLFLKYGSDKSTKHDYYKIYGRILARNDEPLCVLEIGLGTNNTSIDCNMGSQGKPGASLRSFRDYLPKGEIYGADIDAAILFAEDRIKTFHVDQTDPASLAHLGKVIDRMFDLIIDDGLHSPFANIRLLSFAHEKLKPGGFLVIEDILESHLPIWSVVSQLMPDGYTPFIIKCKSEYAFVVKKSL